jgi:hypothetical protein
VRYVCFQHVKDGLLQAKIQLFLIKTDVSNRSIHISHYVTARYANVRILRLFGPKDYYFQIMRFKAATNLTIMY